MLLYSNNLLAVPLLLIVAAVEAYLLATSLRLVLEQFASARDGRFCVVLRELTDAVPGYVGQRLSHWRQRPTPPWLAWIVVIAGALLLRQLLLGLAVSVR